MTTLLANTLVHFGTGIYCGSTRPLFVLPRLRSNHQATITWLLLFTRPAFASRATFRFGCSLQLGLVDRTANKLFLSPHFATGLFARTVLISANRVVLPIKNNDKMNTNELESFPHHALLPKRETTASSFLATHKNFDGRGVKVAILDSGVDPGAAGLSVTSDGKPKIIDMIDATGSGDVDTSTVVTMDKDGFIIGLTGRKLKVCFDLLFVYKIIIFEFFQIPADWKNPSGKFHVGVKNIYELFPKFVQKNLTKEYQENEFAPANKPLLAAAIKALNEFQEKEPAKKPEELQPAERIELMLKKDELQAQVDILKQYDTKFTDLGPTFDCVVFNNGEKWQ